MITIATKSKVNKTMLVAGIELTASEAVICLLSYETNAFTVPDCRVRSVSLGKSSSTEAIRYFQVSIKKLIEDYSINELVIIERAQKGKQAGSAVSFKLEAALQLIDLPVCMIDHNQIKEQLKRNYLEIDFQELGLKGFQKLAFNAAYAYQCQCLYSK